MLRRDLVLLALVAVVFRSGDGRICPPMDIRNRPSSLEKLRNCTIVMGDLWVVLMDSVDDEAEFEGYSFPELTHVMDFLIVYKIQKLTSIGRLFPNLRVIGGRKRFGTGEYSLVMYKLEHLKEIGLTNLQRIGQGGVKVDYSPNVCYVRTVDWMSLGASNLDFPSTEASDCRDEFCPNECSGHCWNNIDCQKPSVDYCRGYEDDGKCVDKCPASKVVVEDRICLTTEECVTMLNGTWWVFNGSCINACPIFYNRDKTVESGCRYVGKSYEKVCKGAEVSAADTLEEMEGCTLIDGSLEISISNSRLERSLEKYLGNIVTITGYLKIGRSKAITSLGFLKNLTTIKGEKLDNNRFSLFVFENANLRRLWNFTDDFKLKIKNGTMGFHDNPQLCLSEIIKLEGATGFRNGTDMEISKDSNGYKSICNQKDMKIDITENNPTNVTMVWETEPDKNNENVLGYTVYYVSADRSFSDNEDACEDNSWDGIFVRENKIQLKDLQPFTPYIFYIKTYTTLKQGRQRQQQTPIYNFTTASSKPSEPIALTAEALTDSTIVLNWRAPDDRNGDLTHYVITMFMEEDYPPTIQQRNYCDNPHVLGLEAPPTPTSLDATKVDNCTCPQKNITELFTRELYCSAQSNDLDSCIKTLYHPLPESPMNRTLQKREMASNRTDDQEYTVPANETTYEFTDLKHFTLYVFYLKACNSWRSKEVEKVECGNSEMISQRTKKKKNADVIRKLRVEIDSKNAHIVWLEPDESNSVLVAYQIEYKRTDSEHSKPRIECITQDEYQSLNRVYKIRNLTPGKYSVHVQAISLAGPGLFSEWNYFEIRAEATSHFTIIGPICAVVLLVLIFFVSYYWYQKKHAPVNNHLIASINPDYAGPIYVEDEWEIERNDIDIIRDLGQGSFGMVYQGMIKSRRYACAIKTVNESASLSSRFEFLNEGSVMKTFSDGYHVVKLLGIVSRGQPPLVVMELMERGDLKSYLRRCREPSQNLTTNELYRMAAEIADGMAYLSAKKFIHRDLAARNCMVAADRTVKIGDFGMARDVYETDYYRKETVGLLPVRWMAPESLADGVFTTDSDIWSYGVVLWEMATLAEQPYQGMSNEEVFHFVKTRGKLERPSECSDFLFEIMDVCLSWRPNDRPTFSVVVHRLADHVGEDFRLVAFCFSRQGREWALNAGPRPYNPPAIVPGEDDYFGQYDAAEEEVNLYVRDRNRPVRYLPFSNQRNPSPERISPGSPSSAFSFNSS